MSVSHFHIFMKRSFTIFFTICCLALPFSIYAQVDTLFWFAGPDVTAQHANSEKYVEIRITSLSTDTVQIKLSQPANPGSPIKAGPFMLAPGATRLINLNPFDKALIESRATGQVLNTGILLTSTGPISAYYEVGRSGNLTDPERNGEIFTMKGNNALGTHFFTPFQNIYANASRFTDAVSSIDMLATKDNTTITVKLTQPGMSGNILYPAGVPFKIKLNKGQVYSVKAQSQSAAGHMSGSEIISDSAIAITQNDDSIESTWSLPKADGSSETGIDIVGDQLVPVNVVGTEYIVVRGFLGTNMTTPVYDKNKVFIVPVQDGTDIFVDGVQIGTGLAAGTTLVDTLSSVNSSGILAARITGNKPFYVYYVSGYGTEMGGPLLPPVNCTGSSEVAFVRSSPDPFFLTILTTQDAIGSFLVQNSTGIIVATDFVDQGNGWFVAQKKMNDLTLSATGIPPNEGIIVKSTNSYFHLGIINGTTNGGTSRFGYFSDFQKFRSSLERNYIACPNIPVLLDPQVTGLDSANTKWFLTPNLVTPEHIGPTFKAVKPGTYKVFLQDKRHCSIDTVVTLNNYAIASFDLGNRADTVCSNVPNPITVNGSWKKIHWAPLPAGVTIADGKNQWNAVRTGDYGVTVTDNNNCQQKDTVNISYDPTTSDSLHIGPSDKTVCVQIPHVPNPIVVKGAYKKLVWSAPELIPDNTYSVDPKKSGQYTATVTTNLNCNLAASVNIKIDSLPAKFDIGSDKVVCSNVLNPIVVKGGPFAKLKWTGPENIADDVYNIDPKKTGTYTATAYNTTTPSFTCSATKSVKITYDGSIDSLQLRHIMNICKTLGDSIFVPKGAYTIHWTPPVSNPVLNIPDGTSVYYPTISGTYKVTVTSQNCTKSDTSAVAYVGTIDLGLHGADTAFCYPYNKNVITVPGGYDTYTWVPNVSKDSSYTPVFADTTYKKFKVTVTKSTCTASDSIFLTYVPKIEFPFIKGGDTTACGYAHYTIRAGEGFSKYIWSNNVNVADEHQSSYVPTSSGKYQVTVYTARGGCKDTSAVTNVKFVPDKPINLGPPVIYCRVSEKPFTPLDAGPGYDSYMWENDPLNNKSIYFPPFPNISSSVEKDTVVVRAVYEEVCVAYGSKEISYIKNDSIFISGPDSVCVGEPALLSSGVGFTAYFWYYTTGGSSEAIGHESSIQVTRPGSYRLIVSSQCNTKPASKNVENYAIPALDLGKDTTICIDKSLVLMDLLDASDKYTYFWTENISGKIDTSTSKTITVNKDGIYSVVASDKHGCTNTDSIKVLTSDVGNCFMIPNLITPNHDDNKFNETFAIKGILPDTWRLEIYNRWGDKVYESKGYNNDWSADNVSDGVYFYHLQHPVKDRKYKGWLQVTR